LSSLLFSALHMQLQRWHGLARHQLRARAQRDHMLGDPHPKANPPAAHAAPAVTPPCTPSAAALTVRPRRTACTCSPSPARKGGRDGGGDGGQLAHATMYGAHCRLGTEGLALAGGAVSLPTSSRSPDDTPASPPHPGGNLLFMVEHARPRGHGGEACILAHRHRAGGRPCAPSEVKATVCVPVE